MARHLRRLGPSLAVAASLLVLPAAARAAPAQALAIVPYDAIVNRYLTGDADRAVLELSRWPRADVAAAAKEWARRPGADQRHAAMLHTDLAYVLMLSGAAVTANGHLSLAFGIIDGLARRDRDHTPRREFAQRWFEFTASLYTAQGLLDEADHILIAGLSHFPKDPMLYVARGVNYEARLSLNRLNVRGAVVGGNLPRLTPARALDRASAEFRHALDLDPTLAIASLHLGWLRFTASDARGARDLDDALAHATDVETRYLARLMRGMAAERSGRMEEARAEYLGAMDAGARYQTAYVALSRVEEALGRSDRARAVAQEYIQLAEKVEDPWWDFRIGGFNSGALQWLRIEVRR